MADDVALVRQWKLLRILSGRRIGATVRELAEEMRVAEKTIRRDLEVFRTAGFPLLSETGDFGRKSWRLRADGDLPELNFAFDEALSLYLGRQFFEPLAGTVFWDAAQRAFKKIRACLGEGALKYLESVAQLVHYRMVGFSDYSLKADLIDTLMMAIEDRRQTFIAYQSLQSTEPVSYPVYPYALAYYRGSLYLIAHAPDHDEVRHYKVDRMETAELTEVPFQRPEAFDLDQHFAGSFGIFQGRAEIDVRICFLPSVRRYVEEGRWHASQQLAEQKDGSLLADFRLSDTEEIRRWVLSFGGQAIVVAPEELRAEVAADAARIAASHAAPAAAPTRKRHQRA